MPEALSPPMPPGKRPFQFQGTSLSALYNLVLQVSNWHFPPWFGAVSMALVIVLAAIEIWQSNIRMGLHVPLIAAVTLGGTALTVHFTSDRMDRDRAEEAAAREMQASQKRIEDGQRQALEEQRQINKRTTDTLSRLEEKFDHFLAAQTQAKAEKRPIDLVTWKSIADSIDAANCVELFDLGWKLYLLSGSKIVKESSGAFASNRGINSIDWSPVRAIRTPGNTVDFTEPTIRAKDLLAAENRIHLTGTQAECQPIHWSSSYSVGGELIRVGGTVIDREGDNAIAIIGVRDAGKDKVIPIESWNAAAVRAGSLRNRLPRQ